MNFTIISSIEQFLDSKYADRNLCASIEAIGWSLSYYAGCGATDVLGGSAGSEILR